MPKLTFRPGVGFPARLATLLAQRNLRRADVERMTEGKVNADTIGGWINRKHLPEQTAFLQVANALRLTHTAARDLLRQPGEPHLRLATKHEQMFTALDTMLNQIEATLPDFSPEEREHVKERVLATARKVRELGRPTTET